ncbi:MAG: ATP-binding protein [Myxococcota bacterium]|nr:ATP-binding protein [Myxococcota bacterium]
MPRAPYDGSAPPRRRRRRRRHTQSRERLEPSRGGGDRGTPDPSLERASELAQIDESLLDEDERAYLEARRRAEEKVDLYRELVKVGPIALILLIFLFPIGVCFTAYQVMRIGRRTYQVLIEPGVRDRLVADEVGKRLDARVQAQRRAMEGEHARSLEKLSASIAHEIRNPITAAKSLVQQMGEEPSSADNVEYANVALGELERVERSVSHLLRFARDEEMREQNVVMAEVLDSALETFRERSARDGITIERSFDTDGALRGDPEKLRRIAINLVGNAIDALADSATADRQIVVALGENLAGSEVWVRVRDNGPGIEPEVAARIFDPFFTQKQAGTGLGLSITRKLVEAHGGEIELASELGQGTEFLVTFPKESRGGAR